MIYMPRIRTVHVGIAAYIRRHDRWPNRKASRSLNLHQRRLQAHTQMKKSLNDYKAIFQWRERIHYVCRQGRLELGTAGWKGPFKIRGSMTPGVDVLLVVHRPVPVDVW